VVAISHLASFCPHQGRFELLQWHRACFTLADEGRVLLDAIEAINKFEGARLFAYDDAHCPNSLSSSARTIVAEGMQIPLDAYFDARRCVDTIHMRLDADLEGIDTLVTPSSPGEAPEGLSYTGPITFKALWTAAYTPALTMPAGTGSNGLPLGLPLVARQYDDSRLLGVARWVERALDLRR
jgi:Asp-tRNA(Asn)/Glu-tRNA(Gln) amidotransferase A subunit family amidase